MEKNIKTRIKSVMSTVFNVPLSDINDESSSDSVSGWDSLKHMTLVIALEEEFDIVIPDEDVANILTYKLIEYVVNENIGK